MVPYTVSPTSVISGVAVVLGASVISKISACMKVLKVCASGMSNACFKKSSNQSGPTLRWGLFLGPVHWAVDIAVNALPRTTSCVAEWIIC